MHVESTQRVSTKLPQIAAKIFSNSHKGPLRQPVASGGLYPRRNPSDFSTSKVSRSYPVPERCPYSRGVVRASAVCFSLKTRRHCGSAMTMFSGSCKTPSPSPLREAEGETKATFSCAKLAAIPRTPAQDNTEHGDLLGASDGEEEHLVKRTEALEDDSDVDVALEALRFSVCTKTTQRQGKTPACGAEASAGECEKRLQKVVDKKAFSGQQVLPLEEFLKISQTKTDEPRKRVSRTDIYRRGRVPWQGNVQPASPPEDSASSFPSSASSSCSVPLSEVRDAFVLDGVFSAAECEWLRRRVEEGPKFTYWDSTGTANSKYRSAYTVEVDHAALADVIWERIKDWVIPEVTIEEDDEERGERDLVGEWIACGVNPHLLFAKYTDGAHFGPHSDGCSAADFNTRTLWPTVLYLNDVEDGGETLVIDNAQKTHPMVIDEAGRHTADPQFIVDSVEALAGRMLFFYHTQMHEGRRVGPGASKFIIRTDVLYRRKIPLLTTPKDQEAFALWQRAELLAEEGQADEAAVLFRKSIKLSPDLAAIYGMA
ncbi:tetratricopeptide repeat-containing protein [Toxoplasma gondii GT1]|uniref:Tetratricopeptide repeat-containing protein n=3 Tax=Toxoplasma gondii TaxID=5811 RepID=S7V0Q8_TOXGG|nr:tetratricopeptide repeat-containing protein [Toxoplasma gondii GT1]KAF4638447.1 tetratricopeptide repeat-containing protein [Toxoplasma gondii]RQX71935.1 tetratricopeptide repeat-containing protein [Toxoplasma gondii CAST]